MAIPKEQLRQIIKENDIQSVGDIYNLLKDSFKDMMQEMLEAEMDVSIGYPKNEKSELVVDNKRNGYSSKTVKSQFGEFELDIPRDRNALNEEHFYNSRVIRDMDEFKKISDIIVVNRMSDELQDVYDKLYTRDLYQREILGIDIIAVYN